MAEIPVLPGRRQPSRALRLELGRAGREMGAQVRSGVAVLVAVHHDPRALLVLVAWVAGIAGDAWTTLVMEGTGLFEEANPFAAYGMGQVGVAGWVAVASLMCVVMMVASLGRATGVYARTLLVVCLVIGAGKLYTALGNYVLLTSVTG